jgi:hypothetical protein
VVADATFFTLRNKGISATQKQQLIDIANAAEANQSTIKTNIANALNSKIGTSLTSANAWTDIINTIPSANAKKFASGSGTTGTTYYTITDSSGSGTSTNAWLLTVNGLSFKPSKVIIFHPTNRWLSVYNADDSYVGNGTNVVYIKLSGVGCYFGTFPQTNIQVVNGGFTLPVATAGDVSGGLSCKWYAYE